MEFECKIKRFEEKTVETDKGETTNYKVTMETKSGEVITITQEEMFDGLKIGNDVLVILKNIQKTLKE